MSDIKFEDEDYSPEDKRVKFQFDSAGGRRDGDMLQLNVQYGLQSMYPEISLVMKKLSTEFHMSKTQIEGSLNTTVNLLFGREWKCYSKHSFKHE